jgi:hypothetical protein
VLGIFFVIDLFAQMKQLLWRTFKKAGSWPKSQSLLLCFSESESIIAD